MIAVGIDIAKDKIDVWMNNHLTTLKNNRTAIEGFFSKVDKAQIKVLIEATGSYHRLTHRILGDLGVQTMVINPYQSRHFARSMNVICKTDKVDAKILSQYAEKMDFKPTPVPTELEEKIQNLIRHIDFLKKTLISCQLRQKTSDDLVQASCAFIIQNLKSEILKIEAEVDCLINSNEALCKKRDIIKSAPGVGRQTANVLIGLMRELGHLDRNAIAALSGLAPINCDSGKMKGRRRIQKGQHDVRRHLYMPVLGAVTKHNPLLKEFYERLIKSGKPAKVALTACMRKLIIILNMMVKTGENWRFSAP